MAKEGSNLAASDFVHLHNHTHYSLLDGLTKVPALVEKIDELGMKSAAITDHGTLSGVVEFYTAAKETGIKPIIGIEAYIAPRRLSDRDPAKDKTYYHLIILAMNNTGYANLMRLSTIANLEGFYYKPRIDRDTLEKYSEGLIVLSGCIGGEVGDALRNGQYQQAKETANWYKSVFGDRYYLEVQDHGHPKHPSHWSEQNKVNQELLRVAKELDIEAVLTCDAHYLEKDDQEAHECLLCVQTGSFLSDSKRMTLKQFDLSVTDPREVIGRWGQSNPEIIKNSGLIAERCNVELELGKILIPKFPVPTHESEKDYLRKKVFQGLSWRYGNTTPEKSETLSAESAKELLPKSIVKRADIELEVIERMNFASYFLIIADFVVWGKKRGIVFGPGRGSAAGSIIAYALQITELDPLKYDLLFERFLNPERISMPDIDIDIQDNRRDEVINYCIDKYGSDRVANILTFGRMAARNAVRDVARVLEVPYATADRLAKMIPPPVQGRHTPLSDSLKKVRELKEEYTGNETAKRVFDLAMRLEGTIRSHGVHAAGVVIAPEEIVKYTPLELAQKGVVTTQYSMGPIDQLGLLKIDFLGLSNLTIIKNALRIIRKVNGASINIDKIPLDDKKTFDLLRGGDTTGVFQLESSGMKRYLKELKPTQFEDIIAMVSLYRPGPLTAGLTQKFIDRKVGREPISYDHPSFEVPLRSTYGVIVYQEQVMQISQKLCGFSGGQADTLRKAMGKKDRKIMKKIKDEFYEGAIKTSKVNKQFLDKFWKELEGFADYAFNKSHAACYGLIAYWTAYLKAHYPAAFMASLMTSDYDNTDRLAIEISECQHMGIEVLPPDVNESFLEFAVMPETGNIRFGLSAIKNVGTAAVEEILRAREIDRGFKGLEDFLSKINPRIVNRKTLEALIKTGSFDSFNDRGVLLNNLDTLIALNSRAHKDADSGQTDLFAAPGEQKTLPKLNLNQEGPTYNINQRLAWERELMGIYLSGHPLSDHQNILAKIAAPIRSLSDKADGQSVTIGGSVAEKKEIITKNGQKMAFVTVTDGAASVEVLVFPSTYVSAAPALAVDNVVLVKGRLNLRERDGSRSNEPKVIAVEIKSLDTKDGTEAPGPALRPAAEDKLFIRLSDSEDKDLLINLKKIMDSQPGSKEVVLVVGKDSAKQAIRLPNRVNVNDELVNQVGELVGADKVKLG